MVTRRISEELSALFLADASGYQASSITSRGTSVTAVFSSFFGFRGCGSRCRWVCRRGLKRVSSVRHKKLMGTAAPAAVPILKTALQSILRSAQSLDAARPLVSTSSHRGAQRHPPLRASAQAFGRTNVVGSGWRSHEKSAPPRRHRAGTFLEDVD